MKIAIIGAGATGLSAGYRLSRQGYKVDIFESNKNIGGLTETIKIGKTYLEKFYHHIFTSDTYLLNLIKELGLSENLKWLSPKNGIYMDEKLYSFTSPLDLMLFPKVSILGRLRMGFMVLKAKRIDDWKSLEMITAKEWIVENAGLKCYEKIWKPLLHSKFGKDADSVSAVWIWNKFKLRGSSRDKKLGGEVLGYMKGSFGILYKKLGEEIEEKKGNIFLDEMIIDIKQNDDLSFHLKSKIREADYDMVLMSASQLLLPNIYKDLKIEFKKSLRKIKYKANICALIEMTDKLTPYYWVTIADEKSPFVLIMEHTNLIKDKKYESHIIYLSSYLDEEDKLYQMSNDDIKKVFIDKLKHMFKDFNYDMIKKIHISKTRFAQPIVKLNYSKIKPSFETPIKNLFLASMAHIYPEDRGQNYAIRTGYEVADYIVGLENKNE